MALYNCYVLGPDRKITSRHEIEAADDAEAMVKASQVLSPSNIVPMIEVWIGARLPTSTAFRCERRALLALGSWLAAHAAADGDAAMAA